eukprot:839094-Pyramimonas_sp.AAC.1
MTQDRLGAAVAEGGRRGNWPHWEWERRAKCRRGDGMVLHSAYYNAQCADLNRLGDIGMQCHS